MDKTAAYENFKSELKSKNLTAKEYRIAIYKWCKKNKF